MFSFMVIGVGITLSIKHFPARSTFSSKNSLFELPNSITRLPSMDSLRPSFALIKNGLVHLDSVPDASALKFFPPTFQSSHDAYQTYYTHCDNRLATFDLDHSTSPRTTYRASNMPRPHPTTANITIHVHFIALQAPLNPRSSYLPCLIRQPPFRSNMLTLSRTVDSLLKIIS
ncbi:hypothetical protein M378DRAFT_284948 [Amanita muscaria Koide BX008]|uniref:Uncharacterized protein n=1 Tax=Amanita muscaria (strain Koide BX008) TaxID=946122 RepID=A0A0C2WQF9_AMAMK|nr:hypothetical protein M378DRAFT_284948 [Amanita muscaria Koide BX008]